jgi:YD repeat-containing protein
LNSPSVSYLLTETAASQYDLSAIVLTPPSSWDDPTETYAFSYASHLMTSWWDPQSLSLVGLDSDEATNVSYGTGDRVSSVEAPTVTDQGASGADTYQPKTTFQYLNFDFTSGTGTVEISDPIANYNVATESSLRGGTATLDTYQDWTLASQVKAYGPLDDQTVVSSKSATDLRDPLTLLPDETIDSFSDTGAGSTFFAGITLYQHDPLGNLLSEVDSAPMGGNSAPNGTSWQESSYNYNAFNEVASSTDFLGETDTDTYDSRGNLVSQTTDTSGADLETEYLHNSAGNVCVTLSPQGVEAGYDLSGYTCSSAESDSSLMSSGFGTSNEYDAFGDAIQSTDQSGDVTQFAIDADGNVCATLDPAGVSAGDSLLGSSCPTVGGPFEDVILATDTYGNSSLEIASSDDTSGLLTQTCYDNNANPVDLISGLVTAVSCSTLTSSSPIPDIEYLSYDADGQLSSDMQPTLSTSTPYEAGPTQVLHYDPDGNNVGA